MDMVKEDILKLRITSQEKELIRQAGEKVGMTISDFVRLASVRYAIGLLALEPGGESEFRKYIDMTNEIILGRVKEQEIRSFSPSPSPSPSPEIPEDPEDDEY